MVFHMLHGRLAELKPLRLTLLHHACGSVHGVAKESVARELLADDTTDHLTSVQAHPEFHIVLCLQCEDLVHRLEQPVQQHAVPHVPVDLNVSRRDPNRGNILLLDGFDLGHFILAEDLVHGSEELVEDIQETLTGAFTLFLMDPVEVLNHDEEDRCTTHLLSDVCLGLHHSLLKHMRRHHGAENLAHGLSSTLLLAVGHELHERAPLDRTHLKVRRT
mmetsp:Transcript_15003/g.41306  ORF Transcript_15003/g.41306 Transcript_15003/m.41306 type:complete len:218 (+) Transcript_15003:1897-2550(+)